MGIYNFEGKAVAFVKQVTSLIREVVNVHLLKVTIYMYWITVL